MLRERCPLCTGGDAERFLFRTSVPVHQHALCSTPAQARAMKRGTLDMRLCARCGFAFNAAFDPTLVDYGPNYDNSQEQSPAFDAYLDELVNCLVTEHGLRNGRVVEVGCGKGAFLNKLLAHPENHSEAVGFDPSYLGPERLGSRARLIKEFYTPATAIPADAVICRHVIEHIPEPLGLLHTIRAAVGSAGTTQVFFETPGVDWILRNRIPWDFFYEHCSLFTAESLRYALEKSEFEVIDVKRVFGEQYLWAEGCATAKPLEPHRKTAVQSHERTQPVRETLPTLHQLAREFSTDEQARVERWTELLDKLSRGGPVFAWGAGAKGVTFCNLADPERIKLAGVVDVNPLKQGKFLPGTGHPIVTPEIALAANASAVLVFNPNYTAEVRSTVERHQSHAETVDLMQEVAT